MKYGINYLERNLSHVDGIQIGRTGRLELLDVASRLRQTKLKGRVMSMIDYADFNIQHSLELQSKVSSAIKKCVHSNWTQPDQLKAVEWCEQAFQNSHCIFLLDSGVPTEIHQGLFSGMLGTDFVNTLFNLAYFNVATAEVKDMYRHIS
ncbi:Uncharacterized protein FKW44_013331 [Caligus rogercresseyi]|uniref:Uncharacterized protein n=1 Tax=Caligus rogercresseyi TaxID=217165 RepID=A0A7T8HL31_CALRO|nr:Uncharacterized protein FKW44_013331 [Caligus rogercresseyi]